MIDYHQKINLMKKIIILFFICFFSSLHIDTYAASIEKNKTEFQDLQISKYVNEDHLISNLFLSELSYGVTNVDQEDGSCTVTIYVYGPLGEPYGTFTGTSWISCEMALAYAVGQMLAVLWPL